MKKVVLFMAMAGSAVAFLALIRVWPRPPLLDGVVFSQAVYDRDGRLMRLTLAPDGYYRLRTTLGEMSLSLPEVTLLQEDRHFYNHPGVNPFSLIRSVWNTYVIRQRRMGGSTVTMQLVRIKYGLKTTTISGKLAQIARAIELELLYSKREILEAYLNLAPYGSNIEGVGAASLVYFGKDPAALTLSEAITLAVIPQNPVRRDPSRSPETGNPIVQARSRLFGAWAERHPMAEKARRAEFDLPLDIRDRRQLPFRAPHYTEAVLRENPAQARIVSNLDSSLQGVVERVATQYVTGLKRIGISNASVVLADWKTGEIRALVGSADYRDGSIDGQVNGAEAKRSPGSTLKPFIYGLAFEQGLIHPATVLKDAPKSFGEFNPENFDGEFAGPLPASEALVKSRNVPAVYVASQLKSPGFYGFLRTAGIKGLREEEWYGLATVLGGVELTLEELVSLYAMLPNGGMLRPLSLSGRVPAPETRLLKPEAAFMVLDVLTSNPRPDNVEYAATMAGDPVAWKTGTSSGFRDAWTLGVFGPYVLGVWVGNFDGSPNPAFIGREAAAPLFFRLVSAIRHENPRIETVWSSPNPALKLTRVKVCPLSGQIPGAWCPRKTETWFIPGVSPIRVCDIHRPVFTDPLTGRRTCMGGYTAGTEPTGLRPEIFEFWPSDILKLFRLAGLPRRVPPPLGSECGINQTAYHGLPPDIVSPRDGLVYSVPVGKSGSEAVPFTATADADARELFWFVNEEFAGKSRPDSPLFWKARSGSFVVRVADDHGRSRASAFNVELVR